MHPGGLIFIALGIFTIAGAAFNWDWYMNNYKARMLVDLFGRDGARVVYVVLGVAITVGGVMFAIGAIPTRH